MVDVFDRHGVRFDPRLAGCSKFVRHSDYATLDAQLAETQGYLRNLLVGFVQEHFPDNTEWKPLEGDLMGLLTQIDNASTIAREYKAQLAARTGGVKETDVLVCPQCEGEGSYADGLDDAACTTTCTRCGSNGWIADLSALEPAAPEAQQEPVADEPVAFLIERMTGAGYGRARKIIDAAIYDPRRDDFWIGDGKKNHRVTPLYPRPSEQAVTEAAGPFITFANHAVEKTDDGWVWRTSSNERICDWFGPSDFGALKAAMEAGRHE